MCGGSTNNENGECDCGTTQFYAEDRLKDIRKKTGYLWKFEKQIECYAKQPTVFTNLEARFPDFLKCLTYYNNVVLKLDLQFQFFENTNTNFLPLSKIDVIAMGRILQGNIGEEELDGYSWRSSRECSYICYFHFSFILVFLYRSI